ncbi:CPBP family intramembrane glutamic endopeptidase [Arthrobacter sp. NPDC056493]|uniref:CPBP family intramembrane glutamic endopeptidase n=1 Tax=Arthrobacter sp. NPDC056493 TaxID=3345839 RepID=UPI00366BD6D1
MNPAGPVSDPSARPLRRLIAGRPVTAFLVIAVGLTWLALILSIGLLGNAVPGILAELLILLGTAILVTRSAGGKSGVRDLFRQTIRWRVGTGWYIAAVLALPALTVLIAAASGTFRQPADGWAAVAAMYLLNTLVVGALLGNIWEELAWTGVVQSRLMERHGVVAGSLLTAIPFALIHLPLAFGEKGFAGTQWPDVAVAWGVLLVFAPLFRLLVGIAYLGTGQSLLIVALLHASFNASSADKFTVFDGAWQQIAAATLLLVVLALLRRFRALSAEAGHGASVAR